MPNWFLVIIPSLGDGDRLLTPESCGYSSHFRGDGDGLIGVELIPTCRYA